MSWQGSPGGSLGWPAGGGGAGGSRRRRLPERARGRAGAGELQATETPGSGPWGLRRGRALLVTHGGLDVSIAQQQAAPVSGFCGGGGSCRRRSSPELESRPSGRSVAEAPEWRLSGSVELRRGLVLFDTHRRLDVSGRRQQPPERVSVCRYALRRRETAGDGDRRALARRSPSRSGAFRYSRTD